MEEEDAENDTEEEMEGAQRQSQASRTTAFSRLLRVPTVLNVNNRKALRIHPHDRLVWFVVLDVAEEESNGPFSVNELCQQWHDGLIDGDTFVWSTDQSDSSWARIDAPIHRPLKALLLRPYLPPISCKHLHDASHLMKMKRQALMNSLFDEATSQHKPKLLHLLSMDLSCSNCGCLASVGCLGCKQEESSQAIILNGLCDRSGFSEDAHEVIPGFLWFGSKKAIRRRVINSLSITHAINATEDLPALNEEQGEQEEALVEFMAGQQQGGGESDGRPGSRGMLGRLGGKDTMWAVAGKGNKSTKSKAAKGQMKSKLQGTKAARGAKASQGTSKNMLPTFTTMPLLRWSVTFCQVPLASIMSFEEQAEEGSTSSSKTLLPFFEQAYEFIEKARAVNQGYLRRDRAVNDIGPLPSDKINTTPLKEPPPKNHVLIYSDQGNHRSPLLVAAYLIRAYGFSPKAALDALNNLHPDVEIEGYFYSQLELYRQQQRTPGTTYCSDCFAQCHGKLTDRRGLTIKRVIAEQEGRAEGDPAKLTTRRTGRDPVTDNDPAVNISGEVFPSMQEAMQFTQSLAQWSKENIAVLDLKGVLDDDSLRTLTTALLEHPRPSITALCLAHNSLTDEALAFLINTINLSLEQDNRPQLSHLDLENNRAGSKAAQAMMLYLKDMDCELATLILANNAMEDDAVFKILDALSPPESQELANLQQQHVDGDVAKCWTATVGSSSSIGDYQSTAETRLKLYNTSLTALNLSGNGLGQLSYRRLGHAFQDNKVLSHLSLSGCISITTTSKEPSSSDLTPPSPMPEFLDALQLIASYSPDLIGLNLSCCSMGDSACGPLATALATSKCYFEKLQLASNGITDEGVSVVAEALKMRFVDISMSSVIDHHLLYLDLSSNSIGSKGILSLAQAFLGDDDDSSHRERKCHVRIETLDLSGCKADPEAFGIFGQVLALPGCSLKHLSLSDNRISCAAIEQLTAGLAHNTSLVMLNLHHTSLGIEGAKHLADALYTDNRSVKYLYLGRNQLRDVGAYEIARILRRNWSLEEMDLSLNMIGDNGMLAIYDALRSRWSDSREKKMLDLNLNLMGNGPSFNARQQGGGGGRLCEGSYETMIPPHLARSKQTLRYAQKPYLDPIHDVPAWGRGEYG